MPFPDSRKKAPNVFFEVFDDTGSPTYKSFVPSSTVITNPSIPSVPPLDPVANFVGTPLSGDSPLSVSFTDLSTNNPTSWAWDFQNNGSTDSTLQNPVFEYSAAGTYTVKLTATNATGSNTVTKTNYLSVTTPLYCVPDPYYLTQVGDPYWADVVLLLDGETLTDSSSVPKTIAAVGGATTSTSQKKYGVSSLAFDGTGDAVTAAAHADFAFGADDYTLECFVRMNSLAVSGHVLKRAAANSYYPWAIQFNSVSGRFVFNVFEVGSPPILVINLAAGTTTIVANTWHHVAATRRFIGSSVVFTLWVDGVLQAEATVGSLMPYLDVAAPVVGGGSSDGGQSIDGYVDEIRITRGVARYISNFRVPQEAYPDFYGAPIGGHTILLLHFNDTDGSTVITDSSPYADHKVASAGESISATQSKFGGTSLQVLMRNPSGFNYSGTRFARPPGTGYALEFWYKRISSVNATAAPILLQLNDGSGSPVITIAQYADVNTLSFGVSTETAEVVAFTPGADGWIHVACSIGTDDIARFYIDGVLKKSEGVGGSAGTWTLYVTGNGSETPTAQEVYMDELRVTQADRYPAAFTPPTLPFCNGPSV